jgi:hypothetical protein
LNDVKKKEQKYYDISVKYKSSNLSELVSTITAITCLKKITSPQPNEESGYSSKGVKEV